MKKLPLSLVAFLSLTLGITTISQGQVKAIPMTPAVRVLPGNIPPEILAQMEAAQAAAAAGGAPVAAAGAPAASGEDASAEREQKKEARLKKLAKLTFNRLPSNILEKWAKPDVDEDLSLIHI